MSGIFKVTVVLLAVAIAGGGIFLATWDIPAPSRTVERVLDDSRFPR